MRGLKIDFESPGQEPRPEGDAASPQPDPAQTPAAESVPQDPVSPSEGSPTASVSPSEGSSARNEPTIPSRGAPLASLPLARALENAIASVVMGPSKLVLALSEDGSELEASFTAAQETTRRRTVHIRLAPGVGIGARAHVGLIDALRERTNGRPGVAAILDSLIKGASSFVLGKDLWSLESFLTPEALDEVPAVAARVLLTRFVPALAAQLPDVPRELLAALLAERTGSDEASLSAIAGAMAPADLLRAIGRVAARSNAVVVFSCAVATDFAAASALEAAASLEPGPTNVLWALGSRRDAWEVQRSLLDDDERRRVERALTPPVVERVDPAAESAPADPAPALPLPHEVGEGRGGGAPEISGPTMGANLAPRARAAARRAATGPSSQPAQPEAAAASGAKDRLQGADETPPLAIPRPLKLKAGFADRLKKSVAARVAKKPQPKKPATATQTATTTRRGSAGRRTISTSMPVAWAPRPYSAAQPTGLKRAVVVALPFLFLASLGIFARREADFRAQRGPTPAWVLQTAAGKTKPPAPAPAPKPAPLKPAPPQPAAPPAPKAPAPAPQQTHQQPPKNSTPVPVVVTQNGNSSGGNVATALPPPPPQPNRRGGLRMPDHAAPKPAIQGTTVQDRLIAAERMPQGHEQLAAYIQIYDQKLDTDADTNLQRRGVLLRLAQYRGEPEALDRITKALDATSPRDLRLTAIQSLSIGNTPLPPSARTRLQTLANEDPDEAIKSAAQIALAAQPR